MKYSRLTYEILKLIAESTFQFAGEIIEFGYLSGKSFEFREKYEYFKSLDKHKVKRQISNLEKMGIIEQIEDEYLLSLRGKTFFKKIDAFYLNLQKGIKWDGKLDILIFDIPELRSNERDLLRRLLLRAGFLPFQKSVYVYPHPVENQINKILNLFPKKQLVLLKRINSPEISRVLIPAFKKRQIVK